MIIEKTIIEDCLYISPQVMTDERGYFYEFYNEKKFEEATDMQVHFVQDNQAYSKGRVLRGFHFQKGDAAQAKLVSVQRGSVQDIAIDLRKSSPSYGKVVSAILTEESKNQLFIPRGCAHGYLTLEEETIFYYKCDNFYNPEEEAGLNPLDSSLSIEWEAEIEDSIISQKDRGLPMWEDCYKFG